MKHLPIFAGLLLSTFSLQAQNTSYNANTAGILGFSNSAFGLNSLTSPSLTGQNNAATGRYALEYTTSGHHNTASGNYALRANTTGYYNAAHGLNALSANTTGYFNAAIGGAALYQNTTGTNNAALGMQALRNNTTGSNNSAVGSSALHNNNGSGNTAIGFESALNNTAGYENTAAGSQSLYYNTTGYSNTGTGYAALSLNTTGNCNTGLGNNTNVSYSNLTNATAIGCNTLVNASNKVRIGNPSVTVIEGQVAYSYPSDARFKTNIKEEDVKGLEFIKKLRPVAYNFDTRKFTEFLSKNMPDSVRRFYLNQDFSASTNIRQSGFIAQEVEKAAKEAQYDFNGVHIPANAEAENYSVAYSEFVVPLVKAVQQQQEMIENLQNQLQQQNDLIESLKKQSSTTGLTNTGVATDFQLSQNQPNPFTHETVVHYVIPETVQNAFMTVYDLAGKQLSTLPIQQKGAASLTITSEKLAAGMYLYSIVADGKVVDTKRMTVAGR